MVFASICEQCVHFCKHKQLSNFSCEQRALKKIQMTSSKRFGEIQMANSEQFEYFVNFPTAGITLLLIGYIVLRQVKANINNLAHTSKTEEQMQSWDGSLNQFQHLAVHMVNSSCYVRKTLYHWVLFVNFTLI